MQEQIMPTTCDWCGTAFNTSHQHPRRHCSIACEEGRAARAMDDPASPDYWLHLQGNPKALVGEPLVAVGLKRTCYSPDWHRDPEDYSSRDIVTHDEENEILVIRSEVYLGRITEYGNGEYMLVHEDVETGIESARLIDASMAVSQIKSGRWYVG